MPERRARDGDVPLPPIPLVFVPLPPIPLVDVPLPPIPLVFVPLPPIPLVDVPLPPMPLADVPLPPIPLVDVPLPPIPLVDVQLPPIPLGFAHTVAKLATLKTATTTESDLALMARYCAFIFSVPGSSKHQLHRHLNRLVSLAAFLESVCPHFP